MKTLDCMCVEMLCVSTVSVECACVSTVRVSKCWVVNAMDNLHNILIFDLN